MQSRARVQAALERKPVDRVPVFMWFHPDTAQALAALLEIPEACLGAAMGNDVSQTWVNNNYAMEGIVHSLDGDSHVDFWGIKWERQFSFNQSADYPLDDATPRDVLAYSFPEEHIETLLAQMLPMLEKAGDTFIGCDVSPCIFEMYWRLRGMQNAMLDMVLRKELARTMFSRCADFSIKLAHAACERYALDWLWTGDDVASQQALMMRPASWRELIKPELARVVAVGKSHGLWVAYHCCGAMRDIIPDLIEIGVDVLNPIQSTCPGMDALELKRDFGSQLAFMGGLDTQHTLPHGSEADVYRTTEELIEGMSSAGGGFILAASHTIPPETPPENIFAVFDAAGITREEILDRAADIRHQSAHEVI